MTENERITEEVRDEPSREWHLPDYSQTKEAPAQEDMAQKIKAFLSTQKGRRIAAIVCVLLVVLVWKNSSSAAGGGADRSSSRSASIVGRWEGCWEEDGESATLEFFSNGTCYYSSIIRDTMLQYTAENGRLILESWWDTTIYSYRISRGTLTITDDSGNTSRWTQVK